MEEPLSTVATMSTRNCTNCGEPAMDGDHPTPLCSGCRENFTRLHIPLWIWLFAGGIAVILLFSLFTLPRSISLGLHLERGKRAMKEKRFNTAEKEFSKVLEKAPSNGEARIRLLIAAFYNQDFALLGSAQANPDDVNTGDEELAGEMEKVTMKAEEYHGSEDFEALTKTYVDEDHIPDTALKRYAGTHADDCYGAFAYAASLYERKNYHECDSMIDVALQTDFEYIPALMLAVNSKRDQGYPDSALTYIDRILAINHESAWGLSAKARTLLRQKKMKEGLDLALKVRDMDKQSAYVLATLILAYHFNGRTGERDDLIKKARSAGLDSAGKVSLQYALDVINNKEKF